MWLVGREEQGVRGDEHFRRGRDEWVGCYYRGAEGREKTDWEAAEGGEEESAGCILESVGGEEGSGVDGFGMGVMGVWVEGAGRGGRGEEVGWSGLRVGLVEWRSKGKKRGSLQDEGAESVVRTGGKDCGAIWGPERDREVSESRGKRGVGHTIEHS